MRSKTDQNFIAFCDELRAYVEEHHLFPDKHSKSPLARMAVPI